MGWVVTKQDDGAVAGETANGAYGRTGPDLAGSDDLAVVFALAEMAQNRGWEKSVYYHSHVGRGYSMQGSDQLMTSRGYLAVP